jgi:hypothetical protein
LEVVWTDRLIRAGWTQESVTQPVGVRRGQVNNLPVVAPGAKRLLTVPLVKVRTGGVCRETAMLFA